MPITVPQDILVLNKLTGYAMRPATMELANSLLENNNYLLTNAKTIFSRRVQTQGTELKMQQFYNDHSCHFAIPDGCSKLRMVISAWIDEDSITNKEFANYKITAGLHEIDTGFYGNTIIIDGLVNTEDAFTSIEFDWNPQRRTRGRVNLAIEGTECKVRFGGMDLYAVEWRR